MTWVLILYISIGSLQFATGGPAVIDGFTSAATCEVAAAAIKARLERKLDWHQCVEVKK